MRHIDVTISGASLARSPCFIGQNIEACQMQLIERFGCVVVIQLGVASELRRFMKGG